MPDDCVQQSSDAMKSADPLIPSQPSRAFQPDQGPTGAFRDETNLRRRRLAGRPRGLPQARLEGAAARRSRRADGEPPGTPVRPRPTPRPRSWRAIPNRDDRELVERVLARVPPERPGDRADRRPPRPGAAGPARPRGDLPLREAPRRLPPAPRHPDRRRGGRPAAPLARVLRPEAGRRHRPGDPDRRDRPAVARAAAGGGAVSRTPCR